MRLPFPYRPEDQVVSSLLKSLAGALDWAAAVQPAQPWVQAVRNQTAELAVDLIESLFGKSTLMRKSSGLS